MKRLFWVGVGAAATVATLRKAREVTDKHVPAGARSALGAAHGVTTLARRTAAEFRAGTAEREAELRADLLAGADLPRSRARVDAWKAERADRARAREADDAHDDVRSGSDARPGAPATTARRGSAAAAAAATPGKGTGSHRAEDPDDDSLGYSFY